MLRSLPLALLPLLLAPLPAVAGGGHSGTFTAHAHGFHAGHFGHFNHFHRFAGSQFFAPLAWGWDDWDGSPAAAAGAPLVIVLNVAPPAAPAVPPPPAQPSISKEAGVTVIRGPGTHHLAP